MEKLRLDRFISNQLNISRSEARTAIRRGRTSVSGAVIRDPSFTVNTAEDLVEFCGERVGYKKHIYIMMNKPSGVLSASTDKSRKTVVDLVPDSLKRANLFPVGRLDRDTTGLLLITDDGEFAHNCIAPKKGIPKVYEAVLDGEITPDMPQKFKEGIVLHDGTKCKSAVLECVEGKKVHITITEGKYHQIKRMFGVFNLGVEKLHRISLGNLVLPKDLKEGECREIDPFGAEKLF